MPNDSNGSEPPTPPAVSRVAHAPSPAVSYTNRSRTPSPAIPHLPMGFTFRRPSPNVPARLFPPTPARSFQLFVEQGQGSFNKFNDLKRKLKASGQKTEDAMHEYLAGVRSYEDSGSAIMADQIKKEQNDKSIAKKKKELDVLIRRGVNIETNLKRLHAQHSTDEEMLNMLGGVYSESRQEYLSTWKATEAQYKDSLAYYKRAPKNIDKPIKDMDYQPFVRLESLGQPATHNADDLGGDDAADFVGDDTMEDKSTGETGMSMEDKSTGETGMPMEDKSTGETGMPMEDKSTGETGMPMEDESTGETGMPMEDESTGETGMPDTMVPDVAATPPTCTADCPTVVVPEMPPANLHGSQSEQEEKDSADEAHDDSPTGAPTVVSLPAATCGGSPPFITRLESIDEAEYLAGAPDDSDEEDDSDEDDHQDQSKKRKAVVTTGSDCLKKQKTDGIEEEHDREEKGPGYHRHDRISGRWVCGVNGCNRLVARDKPCFQHGGEKQTCNTDDCGSSPQRFLHGFCKNCFKKLGSTEDARKAVAKEINDAIKKRNAEKRAAERKLANEKRAAAAAERSANAQNAQPSETAVQNRTKPAPRNASEGIRKEKND